MLSLDVPEPGFGITCGFNVADAPAGSPETFNCNAWSKPAFTLVVAVAEPVFPCCTVIVAGSTLMLNGAVAGATTVRFAPAMELPTCPRIVTDSDDSTAVVVTGKVTVLCPSANSTLGGGCTAPESELLTAIFVPPAGAGCASVRLIVVDAPPATLVSDIWSAVNPTVFPVAPFASCAVGDMAKPFGALEGVLCEPHPESASNAAAMLIRPPPRRM